MNCKRAEDVILTDYIDKKLRPTELAEVESHIKGCPACRRLAEDTGKLSGRLRAAEKLEAPPEAWRNIKEGIRREKPAPGLAVLFPDRIRSVMLGLRPAAIGLAVAAMLLYVITAAGMDFIDNMKDSANRRELISAISFNGDAEIVDSGFGTMVEKYLL